MSNHHSPPGWIWQAQEKLLLYRRHAVVHAGNLQANNNPTPYPKNGSFRVEDFPRHAGLIDSVLIARVSGLEGVGMIEALWKL